MKKILFLAANPADTDRLRLEAELRDVEDGLRRSNERDSIQFVSKLALRSEDLRRSLLDNSPVIVHFAGHGAGRDGIALEDQQGETALVGTQALANLFALHKEVKCVVLNACHSIEQADAIAQHIPFVVGMANSVDDRSALAFAVGFYDAIGAGRSIQDAFSYGCNAIELRGLPGAEIPVLTKGVGANESTYIAETVSGQSTVQFAEGERNITEAEYSSLVGQLTATAAEATKSVQCIGMTEPIPFEQIYQPTKIGMRSGLSIQAAAAFGEQNRAAQSIATSLAEEIRPVSVYDFLQAPEHAIVFAGPGWGKTTFLHHIFREKLQDSSLQTILITLRRDGAIAALERIVELHGKAGDSAKSRRLLLLVDGYDEVTVADRRKVSESLLRFAAQKVWRYILTCRDHYQVIGLTASQIYIGSFDKKDQYRFVGAFLKSLGSKRDPTKMVNDLDTRNFDEFLSHPLLLALACIVDCGSGTDQPRSALRLLSKALMTLQYTWDWGKGIHREKLTNLDAEDRLQILKRIAFASRSPFMAASRAEGIARKVIEKMSIPKVDPVLALQEAAQFYGILVPSLDGWEFVHRVVQDYLAARHWVDSGAFANETAYEWNTRTAYAACLYGDATRVLESSLAAPDGLTCAIEVFTNSPDFDKRKVGKALLGFYQRNGRVAIIENTSDHVSADLKDDLFRYLSPRFLNHLIETFAGEKSTTAEVLLGCCLAELRERRLRMDFVTFETLSQAHLNVKRQFRVRDRAVVTAEMARPIGGIGKS